LVKKYEDKKKVQGGKMETFQILVEKNVSCRMRDGVILYADIYRPNQEGRFPVLLTRLPYSKDLPYYSHRYLDTNRLVENGFIVIIQDVRGRFQSEGEFRPFRQEVSDGYDTIEWAAELPYTTGKVGMFGLSYYGYTQLLAATKKPPHLDAIFPAMTLNDQRNGASYRNGVYQPGFTETWTLESIAPDLVRRKYENPKERTDAFKNLADQLNKINNLYRFFPVNQWPPLKELGVADYFYEEMLHPVEDEEFWKESSIIDQYKNIQVPAFHLGGWHDCFIGPTLNNYVEMTKNGQMQKLIIGPWGHGSFESYQGECFYGVHASGDRIELKQDITDLHVRWFNHWLKNIDTGLEAEHPVKIFVLGINQWRDEKEWPLKRTKYTRFYLHSGGSANTKNGDGRLSLTPSINETADSFLYDPKNPVPTKGGRTLIAGPLMMGPFDQREIEERQDVLVYSTEPLIEPIEVTGPVKLKLWASSDAKDTDFTAKFVDEAPDGKSMILADGIVNAKYRNGSYPEKELSGEVIEFEIDLWAISNVFLKGHRIVLEVSSSRFPQYLPNPNTGKSLVKGNKTIKAIQKIFHNEQYPSHLILPIIPMKKI
jgi:putative CocE/NonD family hydrolase